MIGTGWRERQAFLEAVNWTGIDLKLYGVWPTLTADSPLHRFHCPMVVDNTRIAAIYRSAKICINFHRRSVDALTPGPRAFELAACEAFQLSDPRPDLVSMFGSSIPTFDTPGNLEDLIRHYLAPEHDDERWVLAAEACSLVQGETFDRRVQEMVGVLDYGVGEVSAGSIEVSAVRGA